MKIDQSFIKGKRKNQDQCEDALYIGENFVAVIDGATSKSKKLFEGRTSGRVASQLLKEAMDKLDPNIEAADAISILNASLTDWYKKNNLLELVRDNPVERPSASLIIFSKLRQEVWSVGDCLALVGEELLTWAKPLDPELEIIRSFQIELELKNGKSIVELLKNDSGRELIEPILANHIYFQNDQYESKFSYSVIDGFFEKYSDITVRPVDSKIKYIVLASDGYPILKPTLEESEFELERIISEDPLCYKQFKSTKGIQGNNSSFDDRTYVKIILN